LLLDSLIHIIIFLLIQIELRANKMPILILRYERLLFVKAVNYILLMLKISAKLHIL